MNADQQITEILSKYSEPFAGSVWRVQGQAVILHKALERIAAKARIAFDPPMILRAESDEAVILVTGRRLTVSHDEPQSEWSIGEAKIGVNYRVTGRQAAYPYAMAEKRAKDRVILKLIGLHGLLYSEEEADEFKAAPSAAAANNEIMHRAIETGETSDHGDGVVTPDASLARLLEDIRFKIDSYKQADTIERMMVSDDTKAVLGKLGEEDYQEIRSYAWLRIKNLRDAAAKYSSAKAGA